MKENLSNILRKDKRLFIFLEKVILYFLYFLIFITPISKAGLEISFIFVLSLWLTYKILNKRIRIIEYLPKTDLNLSVGVFLLICFLTIVNSVEPKESLRGFIGKWLQWITIYFIFVDVVNTERRIKLVFRVLFSSFVLIILDGIYQFIVGKDFLRSLSLEGIGWITATLGNLNTFGGYLVLISPIVVSFFLTHDLKKIHLRILFISFLLFSLFCLIFSNSVSSWIALSITILGVFLFSKKYKRSYKVVFLLFIFLILTLLLSTPLFRQRLKTLPTQFDLNKGGRLPIWRDTLVEIMKNPILGKGINTTRGTIIKKYSTSYLLTTYSHIHNLFLHILLEMGFLGLLSFIWIIFRISRLLLSEKDILHDGLKISFFGFLISNIFDTHIGEQIFTLFWIITGIIISYDKICRKKSLL